MNILCTKINGAGKGVRYNKMHVYKLQITFIAITTVLSVRLSVYNIVY